ncbi:MAG: ATP synthase F1 subunit delta [Acidimicrobiales bacterium]
MLELVRGYAAAVYDAARSERRLDEVVSGLEGIRHVLVKSEPLRLALTDAAISSGDRRAVVEDLFSGKVGDEVLDLLTFSIATERATEVPKTAESLLELAIALGGRDSGSEGDSAGDGGEGGEGGNGGESGPAEPPIGRSGAMERIRGYAERIFEQLPDKDAVEGVEDELFRFARIAEQHGDLRRALSEPASPLAARLFLLSGLVKEKVSASTSALLAYVLRAGRARDVVGAVDYLVELAAEERGRRVADVRAAVELGDDERERLTDALSRLARRPVELRVVIDESVIGGLDVTVGDTVIDGTVRHRLEALRDSLFQPS